MNNNSNGAGGYFRVQDRLFDWYGRLLGPIPIAAYHYLARCADQDGCCFPSYEDIARKVGISRRAALRAIAKLVKYKLITVKRRRHRQEHRDDYTSNYYKIRLEAFTHAGAHREVVTISHPKDNPIKDNPITATTQILVILSAKQDMSFTFNLLQTKLVPIHSMGTERDCPN
jgi:hypothetical protein